MMERAHELRTKPARDGTSRSAPRLAASSVLQGTREVILIHGSEEYRLKLTSNDKLILTK
ncbi:MAG: hemin uptake protein HemP [Rhizomicrobium sp.]|nr:hemin uptake protein HemP [Rhizomicrobium sp.]